MFLCVYKKQLCEFAICGKITENQERIKMSMFNKFAVMIAFAVCAANAWAVGVMKNDLNAIGILDCVRGSGNSWEEENFDCSAKDTKWSHNFHSTKAICKKFVADAYYKEYKDNTGMIGEYWPDSVTKLPGLIDGRYMLRCVATECKDGYELARDNNGNSMGWCRKKSADKNEETGGADDESQDAGMLNNGESESGTTSTTVFDDLDKFISEKFVGSSVWKNDDGGFNTARLVSDSVAGVVLGTVGGVITSHIIKKNQIENGFDDLKCTIGGQTVASYGDEFRVGVK